MKMQFFLVSKTYETFVRRGLKSKLYSNKGMSYTYFQNLMLAEIEDPIVRHLDSYEKQLPFILSCLDKTFIRCLKTNLSQSEKDQLLVLKSNLKTATTSKEILQIIDLGLEITTSIENIISKYSKSKYSN
jgi:hypothetical protein